VPPVSRLNLPHLAPGRDRQTLLANSLALIKAGFPQAEAMQIALHTAGLKPSTSSTPAPASPAPAKPSSARPPKPTPYG